MLKQLQAHGANDLADVMFDSGNATDAGVEAQVLEHGHLVAGVDLGADAQGISSQGAMFADGDILDNNLAAVMRRANVTANETDGCAFACTIRAE